MRRASTWALLAGALALGACAGPAAGPWQSAQGYRWRALAPAGRGGPGFTSLRAGRAGIDFQNDVSDSAARRNRHLMHGSGVAIGDVDGDGRPDVYLPRIEGPNALYRNLGGWRFADVAREAGVALADRASTGAVFADLDGDGDLDLIVTAMGGRNTLFLNDGRGHFTDATATSGFVPESRGSTTATLADVDGDGDLDLYVTNYKARTMLDSLSPAERSFDHVVRKVGERFEVIPELRNNYRVVLREDIRGVSLVQRADPDWFYLNDGKGHFTRVPLAGSSRFLDERGRPLEREPDDFGLAARFVDFTGDGAPDLVVANDFEDPDQFWVNDGKGNFRLLAASAIRQTSNSAMAVAAADIDRDGRVDLFEPDMLAQDSHRRKTEMPANTAVPKVPGDYRTRAQWQRNVLLHNRGDGSFEEIASAAGVEASGWSWSALFLDVDLDGYEDLLIGNGHTWDLMDADTQERLRSMPAGFDWRDERKLYPKLSLKNVAFRNRGDLTFEDVSARWGFGVEDDISNGMAIGDLDGDGDLDVIVNRLDAPPLLLRNDASPARVEVRLAGRAPNTHGVGAVVRVRGAGAVPEQSREIGAGGLYLSSSEAAATFATGSADSVSIEVDWRDGTRSLIRGPVNREYEIDEAGAPPAPPAPAAAPVTPLFADVSDRIDFTPTERPFPDLARQPLLPWKLSELGPGVSWIDVDGDGRDDLVVGAGAGGTVTVFANQGRGRFRRLPTPRRADSLDLTTVLGLGQGRGAQLAVGRSSYEARSPRQAVSEPAVVRLGAGRADQPSVVAGGDTTSVGPLALADVDGDGDLDLFVGGRVAPAVYPAPGSSRLFRNDGGHFVLDTANAALLHTIGLVSGAVFTDLDGDGDPDLVLAVEWGPIRVLINDAGRFTDRTAEWGLAAWTGRWNGVAAGDFDGDGRLDLVATNWGRNTAVQADSAAPLYLYYGDYNGTGVVETVLARLDSRLQAIAPLTPFARLATVIPSSRSRVPSFTAYADASIDQVLGDRVHRGGRAEARTLDHMVFLNRGDHFDAAALPFEAQLAPAFGVAVADFDGDGNQDLMLAQNFSATDLLTPRFDAGLGVLLRGGGDGRFTVVGSRASGIAMVEDQRGVAVADFDGDGRPDLAVGRSAAPVALFRNQGGKPGLVVRFKGDPTGAVLRVVYPDGKGPASEVHAGAGYWSEDGSLSLGLRAAPVAVAVRWPGRPEAEVRLPPGAREVLLTRPLRP